MEWFEVYNLQEEKDEISRIQIASLSSGPAGFLIKPALFGSKEWWGYVGTKKLPICNINGIITNLYMSGHNDFPEFEVTEGGEKTYWEIYGDQKFYKIGNGGSRYREPSCTRS